MKNIIKYLKFVFVIGHWVRRYLAVLLLVCMVGIYSFLILQVRNLSGAEPSEEAVAEKLQSVKRPRIDEQAAAKLKALEDQNVEVNALFKQARDNPFAE